MGVLALDLSGAHDLEMDSKFQSSLPVCSATLSQLLVISERRDEM